jgi:hypothetical protein
MTFEFLNRFSKKASFIKIRPIGAELFHTEGRTDRTKLIVAVRNFANAPENAVESFTWRVTLPNVDIRIIKFPCKEAPM